MLQKRGDYLLSWTSMPMESENWFTIAKNITHSKEWKNEIYYYQSDTN
jgi:hypothetical protein